MAVCTVEPVGAVNFGAITLGVATHAPMAITTNCAATTPHNITFQSTNGGVGATGILLGASCSLNYAVVSRSVMGVYGISDYFVSPMLPGTLTGTGSAQPNGFGIRVDANQAGCVLQPNVAPITVSDALVVSVNY